MRCSTTTRYSAPAASVGAPSAHGQNPAAPCGADRAAGRLARRGTSCDGASTAAPARGAASSARSGTCDEGAVASLPSVAAGFGAAACSGGSMGGSRGPVEVPGGRRRCVGRTASVERRRRMHHGARGGLSRRPGRRRCRPGAAALHGLRRSARVQHRPQGRPRSVTARPLAARNALRTAPSSAVRRRPGTGGRPASSRPAAHRWPPC